MYSFAQRGDCAVVDEPLYAHYLVNQPTRAIHPARDEILASQPQDGGVVVDWMLHHNFGKKAVIFKQMTHHLVELELDFLPKMVNVLLIRDPRAILASFSKVVDAPTAEDVGIPQQIRLFRKLKSVGGLAAVLDARKLLLNPEGVLSSLCDRIGIPFQPEMLGWEAGPRPEDGVWAPHWYGNVHQSTGFQPFREKKYDLPPALEDIATHCTPLYAEMLAEAL
jgi:hypothetical protein